MHARTHVEEIIPNKSDPTSVRCLLEQTDVGKACCSSLRVFVRSSRQTPVDIVFERSVYSDSFASQLRHRKMGEMLRTKERIQWR